MITSEPIDTQSSPHAAEVRPIVEVVLDPGAKVNAEPATRGASAAAMVAAMARTGKLDAAPFAVEAAPEAPEEAAETPTDETAETPAEAPHDGEKPADAPHAEALKPDEPKVDAVAAAVANAELEAARHEAALLRSQLASRHEGPTADDRSAWVRDPIESLRAQTARMLGVPVDHKDVDEELAFLQRELTYRAIGADTLDQDRKHQRSQEHTDRRWRFDQHAQAASREADKQQALESEVLSSVSSAIQAAAKDFPYLSLAPELDGVDPARATVALWNEAVFSGRATAGKGFAESLQGALRLANDFYKTRHERLLKFGRTDTAPVPAPAPAQASAPAAAPEAFKTASTPAPAKTGSASPGTLTAKQAAAAPSVKATVPAQGPIVIDPSDRDGQRARIAAIAAKHRRP